MDNRNPLEHRTDDTLLNLEAYERRWHIFKAILFVTIGLIIIAVQLATYQRLFHNSSTNRELLRCTLKVALSQKPPEAARVDEQKCLDGTR